jgi:hypothetical protein
MPMLVPMRASPTFAISGTLNWYDGTGTGTVTSIQTAYTTSPSAIEFDLQAATGTTAISRPIIFYVLSGTTGYISASAEII